MSIEGVPEGWELVRIGHVNPGEFRMTDNGRIDHWNLTNASTRVYPIVRKIEKPNQYRPFANAAEFEPFKNRWWRYKDDSNEFQRPPAHFGDFVHYGETWADAFETRTFDDGSPFGVDVDE